MFIALARTPRPAAAYWPGRRTVALLDALAWPALWFVAILAMPAKTGVVGLVIQALSILFAFRRTWLALFRNERYTLVITQSEIQERLDSKFPITKTYLFIFDIEYSNPKVILDPVSNRILATLDAKTLFKVNGVQYAGSSTVSGSLRYKADESAFYIDKAKVEKIDIGNIPSKYADKVDGAASAILCHYLQSYPVYVIKDSNLKLRAAKVVLRDIKVQSGALVITLGL